MSINQAQTTNGAGYADLSQIDFNKRDDVAFRPGSVEALESMLDGAGIDTAQYGSGKAKSVSALFREFEKKDCVLGLDGSGVLYRDLRVSAAHVYLLKDSERTHKLVEKCQIFVPHNCRPQNEAEALANVLKDQSGQDRIRERTLPTSVSEMVRAGESFEEGMIRCFDQELQCDLNFSELTLLDENFDAKISPSYPGLVTTYSREYYEINLTVGDERIRDVYIDIDEISDTESLVGIFHWESVESGNM